MFKLTYDYDPEEAYLKTLEWVNKVRSQRGHPTLAQLSVGRTGSASHCSIALSIDHGCLVLGNIAKIRTNETEATFWKKMRLPGYAKMFIKYFDEGWYPDLVDEDVWFA